MVVGGATMMLISFLFIPNVLCSLWVAFSIVSIELGVVGYMALWNVNLDTISMVNLIMCIGFSVDFTAHICYAYMSSEASSPKDRVQESLYALGLPIIQGAISTVLGVSALILAGSYIFMVFFKMIFLVIVFGALHGMLLLPVLLSLFGPGACCANDKRKKQSIIHQSFFNSYSIPHPSLRHPLNSNDGSKIIGYYDKPVVSKIEKDLGLGTSDDTSEQNSSKSQKKRREAAEEELQRRKYLDGWRKSYGQMNPPLNKMGYYNSSFINDENRHRSYVPENMSQPNRTNYRDDRPSRKNGRYN